LAPTAKQLHGGLGYPQHQPFEHIPHHRRYRITEDAPRKSRCGAWRGYLFGFIKPDTLRSVTG
jgi:hypothetical protein